ncbi:MAG: DUF4105 domain-containing protein [Deltaproteobacteria bacterium]|jgi:hypothetical protein|nr:DUF4105 domain-containing protein [Deltaproteobacteria bacterium]
MRSPARLPEFVLVALFSAIALFDASAEQARVELVTVGPDHPIYTRFGHILLRVIDTETGRDDVYDFGVADFQRPGFAVGAALGRAKFWLRRSSTQIRFDDYRDRDRQIHSQRLNLTNDQVAYLIGRLEWNLLPENVEYTYDHVADNCSTRLRDLLNDVTGGALQRAAYAMPIERTYREEILAAGAGRMLALIALDLGSGPHGEDRVGAWQLSFMPHRMREILAVAENPALGGGTPLVASEQVLHRRKGAPAVGGDVRAGRRLVVAIGVGLGLFFGLCGFSAWLTRGSVAWLSRLAGLVLVATAALFGSLGLALLPISLFSTGTIWTSNQNAWLFFPLDLVLLLPGLRWIWTGRATLATWTRVYIDLRFLMLVTGWLGVVHPQENGAFALAAALTLVGLRTQPLKPA